MNGLRCAKLEKDAGLDMLENGSMEWARLTSMAVVET